MLNTVGEFCAILAAIVVITFIKLLITPESPSIFNVYRTPSSFYCIKTAVMFIILSIQKIVLILKPSKIDYEKFDKPQKLCKNKKALDAIYFNGSNQEGDYFNASISRRNDNLVDANILLKISSTQLGLLEHPKCPSTTFHKTDDDMEFYVEGLKMVPVIPLKKWKITYDGKLKKYDDPTQSYDIQLNLDYISDYPIINNVADLDPLLCAKAIALEPWSLDYFNILKSWGEGMHSAQFGELHGKIVVEGSEHFITMNANQNRSFEMEWDWSKYHRLVFHFITAENGDRFMIGKDSIPILVSNLTSGFVYCASEKKIYPLQSCNFEIYQHGEEEDPPINYAFSFKAGNRQYTMQIKIEHSTTCYISEEWECKVIERTCSAEINGQKGWGSCQWLYRNVYGKNILKENNS